MCDYLKYMYDLSYMINHVMYFGLKMNMFAAAFEKQPCRNISKINSSSEAAIKMHFSISLFCTCGEILWKVHVMESAIFSKFECYALQIWITSAEKLYFISALINAEQQLLQNTSRKLLLCLEAVARRCSSKQVFFEELS